MHRFFSPTHANESERLSASIAVVRAVAVAVAKVRAWRRKGGLVRVSALVPAIIGSIIEVSIRSGLSARA
jgi:hypothetical protein